MKVVSGTFICEKLSLIKAIVLKFLIFSFGWIIIFPFISRVSFAEENLNENWVFSAGAYIWAGSIEGETLTGEDIDIGFSDLVGEMNFSFMGNFTANKGKWGILTDVIYMNVKDDDNVTLNRLLTLREVELTAWAVTPLVTYRILQWEQLDLDVLAGGRYLYLKSEVEIDPVGKSSDSGHLWDGITGIRGKVLLNPKWYLPFHFDIGTGDSKLTWQVLAGVGYKFNSVDLMAAYRHLEWKVDDNRALNDISISGPLAGVRFFF